MNNCAIYMHHVSISEIDNKVVELALSHSSGLAAWLQVRDQSLAAVASFQEKLDFPPPLFVILALEWLYGDTVQPCYFECLQA